MDAATKAKFVIALHKHSLQALSFGGTTSGGLLGIPGALTVQNDYQAQAQNAGDVNAQQNMLYQQLAGEAAGGGPNPAQMQYQQNAQNIAQQQAQNYSANRALNPGLAARMAGNTGANVEQAAASQAATQQAQQQIAAQQQLVGLTGQEQAGSMAAQQINAGTAQNNANAVNSTQKGILSALPGIGSLFAEGGEVHKAVKMAGGGFAVPQAPVYAPINMQNPVLNKPEDQGGKDSNSSGPQSGVGKILNGIMAGGGGADSAAAGAGDSGMASMAVMAARGGAIQSAPGIDLKNSAPASLMKKGGAVKAQAPSQKSKVKDDSLKNDKVPALLSEGEIVIPRHITEHPQAPKKAAEFVQAVLNKRRMKAS